MSDLITLAADLVRIDSRSFVSNIPVSEIAAKADTIVWEIFTGITPRVTRCYKG